VDRRSYEAQVASPATLMVANLHKISERENTPTRLFNNDAYDLYRILRAVSTWSLWLRLSGSCTTTRVDR
jgi:hypothetical protein